MRERNSPLSAGVGRSFGIERTPIRGSVPFRDSAATSDRLELAIMLRRNRPKPELLITLRRRGKQFSFIGDRMPTVRANRLEQSQKNHGPVGEAVTQDHLFFRVLAPFQLGIFHKEAPVLVPTG